MATEKDDLFEQLAAAEETRLLREFEAKRAAAAAEGRARAMEKIQAMMAASGVASPPPPPTPIVAPVATVAAAAATTPATHAIAPTTQRHPTFTNRAKHAESFSLAMIAWIESRATVFRGRYGEIRDAMVARDATLTEQEWFPPNGFHLGHLMNAGVTGLLAEMGGFVVNISQQHRDSRENKSSGIDRILLAGPIETWRLPPPHGRDAVAEALYLAGGWSRFLERYGSQAQQTNSFWMPKAFHVHHRCEQLVRELRAEYVASRTTPAGLWGLAPSHRARSAPPVIDATASVAEPSPEPARLVVVPKCEPDAARDTLESIAPPVTTPDEVTAANEVTTPNEEPQDLIELRRRVATTELPMLLFGGSRDQSIEDAIADAVTARVEWVESDEARVAPAQIDGVQTGRYAGVLVLNDRSARESTNNLILAAKRSGIPLANLPGDPTHAHVGKALRALSAQLLNGISPVPPGPVARPQEPQAEERAIKLWAPSVKRELARRARPLLVVGGNRHATVAESLTDAFGAIEWIDLYNSTGMTRAQSLAARIRGASFGAVVVFNGLLGHKQINVIRDACKSAGVVYGNAERGGVGKVAVAIGYMERVLAARQRDTERQRRA